MNLFFQPKWQEWRGALAAALLLFFLLKPIFQDYFTRPNAMMYSFGGDALVLYYNTAYHTRYGDGSTLRSMNYPDGEYIYLTDAQGAVSNVCQWVNRHIMDISGQTVGIIHVLNLYLLFLAVVLMYYLLRALKVQQLTAILFAPLVVLLSPQIWRVGGHFGLAYPFLIPMAMLWFLRKYRTGRLEKRDALVLGTSVFFTFNNPYTGFNVNFFLVLAGGLLFALEGFNWKNWKRPAIITGMGVLSLAVVMLNFKLFDPVSDRLSPQWGFFYYHASFEGLFHPPNSILHGWLTRNRIMVPPIEFEAMLNVGIVTVIALVVMLLLTAAVPFFHKNKPQLQRLLPEHRILLGASVVLFLLAANTSLINISPEWLERNAAWLLMFKASGRLGWALYFALTVTAVVFIDRLFVRIPRWYVGLLFLLAIMAAWNAEINQYIRPNFSNIKHANFFDRQHETEMLEVLRKNRVNVEDYQAILSLPKMMTWSDKVMSDINFGTQFYSLRLSLATGLPLVNSMLSRIGLQHTLDRVQMLSHPLVERSLPAIFPNQKDILLVMGTDAGPLKSGEQFLLDIAQQVAETPDFKLYRLRLADLQNNAAQQRAREIFLGGAYTAPAIHLGFDEEASRPSFYGRGSHETTVPEEQILDFHSPYDRDTMMVFSAWTYVDARLRYPGFWTLSVRDTADTEWLYGKIETRKTNDVQENWMRSEGRIRLPKGMRLIVTAQFDKPLLIDEVMLWPEGDSPLVLLPDSDSFLFENFKIWK